MSYSSLIAEAANHWPLQDTSGTNENGTDATSQGNPTVSSNPGPHSGYPAAVTFDGNDWFDCGNTTVYQNGTGNPCSIVAWVKINALNAEGWPAAEGSSASSAPIFGFDWNSSEQALGRQREGEANNNAGINDSTSPALSVGTWYFLAFTLDSSSGLTFYVYTADGTQVYTNTDTATHYSGGGGPDTFNQMAIGTLHRDTAPNDFFEGDIAGVANWSRELSQEEVETLVAGPTTSNLETLSAPIAKPISRSISRPIA